MRRVRRVPGILATGTGVALLVIPALLPACDRRLPAADGPFPGATRLELACLREGRAPTRAELEPLVRALVDVAGGEAALRNLSFRRVEDLYLQHSGDPQSNHVRATIWVRPDQTMRTLLEYLSGESEQRVLFRGAEYICARGQPLAAAVLANKQFVEWDWQLARLPLWLTEASSLQPLPPRVEGGRMLIAMHVEVESWNPSFDCLVDPSGPMIVAVEAELPLTGDLVAGKFVKQRIEFSDFRRVDGFLFAFRRDVFNDGRRFALCETREIATGLTLDDRLFLPDGKPPR